MEAKVPKPIMLTDYEQQLFDKIKFGPIPNHEDAIESAIASRELMESLLKRKAIPQIRVTYFEKPYPGGRGKSHLDIFNSNLRGRNLFEDGNFIDSYLRYFIFGPDLQKSTMQEFCRIINEDELKGELGELLRRFVRKEIRRLGVSNRHHFAEEFYKLALECFPDNPFMPERIRKAAMETR